VTKASFRQRLFLALWPDQEVCHRLQALGEQHVGSGRRTPAENLHATLAFLGAVDSDARACVERVAGSIDGQAFSVTLDGLEHRPRQAIVWAAASHIPVALTRLVEQLRAGLMQCGFQPERRPYHLHVTLARKVRRGHTANAIEPIVWHIGDFVLVESRTHAGGARYQVLQSWLLARPEDSQRS
jgi:RNA 2',3'-cyclic 3'-phosphodiesterase